MVERVRLIPSNAICRTWFKKAVGYPQRIELTGAHHCKACVLLAETPIPFLLRG
jgi:hypothetical protein